MYTFDTTDRKIHITRLRILKLLSIRKTETKNVKIAYIHATSHMHGDETVVI